MKLNIEYEGGSCKLTTEGGKVYYIKEISNDVVGFRTKLTDEDGVVLIVSTEDVEKTLSRVISRMDYGY